MKKYKIVPIFDGNFGHLHEKYQLDSEGYCEKYGFGLSEVELNEVYQHIQALEDFISTEEDVAFVYDTIQKSDFIDNFEIPDQNNWNFIILQSKTPFKYLPQQGYKMGYKWTDMNYLVSREGAIIVLNRIKQINQNYCDIILDLMRDKKLTAAVLKDDGFDFINKPKDYDQHRNQEILSSIGKIERWNSRNKEKVRELLNIVFLEAKKINIDLFISEGTLLGCIRHGEIMRWDDDVDLAMNNKDVEKFLESLKKKEGIEIGTANLYGKYPFYKIWSTDCEEIQGYRHRFPFIDIFPFAIVDSKLYFDYGYAYDIVDIFPLSDCNFEGTIAKIPKNPMSYLNNRYPGWKEKIVFYPYSHRIERSIGKLLEAYISVDKTGRIECC
ncbi:LicD family protein [Arcticibacter tournemirensis]|uniref:LicD family protein n=1 Tax=Arcticibacter tournemirensis TaxID=699437 RepID=A0A5M9HBW1_9SPHI|nr:LicD family protein [Arcticibacter tournemirensis]KAA8482397.1 LicD family protein [Arcticibacter tournemirensis]TQM51721.1 LicD family protein [Arcticibacter tournemirensis]